MKTLIVLIVGLASLFAFKKPTKEFVCLPCGRDCDSQIYAAPGQCSSCNMKLIEKSSIHFTNISVNELCNRVKANPNAVILDVRSADEFKGTSTHVSTFGHFKNAININVNDIEDRAKELEKYKKSEILVYCSHAHRSAVASYFLSTHGFENVKNMLGGASTIDSKSNDCLAKSFVVHAH